MIPDPLRPPLVDFEYQVARNQDGKALGGYRGRELYVRVPICPVCHKELDETAEDRWVFCPFCGQEIRWK